jgi:hypothetical protein
MTVLVAIDSKHHIQCRNNYSGKVIRNPEQGADFRSWRSVPL